MRSPGSAIQMSVWEWMLKTSGIYLALEFVPFAIAKLISKAPIAKLAVPYFALALPAIVFLWTVYLLRAWEERGPLPRLLAIAWAASTAVYLLGFCFTLFYFAASFHIVDRQFATALCVSGLVGLLPASFMMYRMTLQTVSARAEKFREAAPHA